MIKPSIFNAINFSNDFNRESKFFDPQLQRAYGLIANTAAYISFEFIPSVMPEAAPSANMYVRNSVTGNIETFLDSRAVTLVSSFVYSFYIPYMDLTTGEYEFYVQVTGYNDIIFSEKCKAFSAADLIINSIIELKAYNNDETHGYISQTYPACGFFQVSEFNNKVFGVEKVEYSYSYGRKKILNAENYIKTRITFLDLSMYQQNLLKTLCNCENLKINGISYYLVSDFTEVDKNEENEICSLRAEFIEIADTTFFGTGATEMPTDLDIKNLFTI